ncbi:uncharacterized protein BT62DRAFT_936327 [Guyanagaster necrorhizus]|uniref:Uncharacterized protein n=1 Tax=Guyanagaster necrorhizus TaxID=856835 RepID=A0A9P7VJD4_9AGAR|nr:uncharacterized protein BT62DRAFT_936327 [Guyanagaster necrorhizus MCA 3950]KAG7442216.1 hypothetical protein BT62DRAFT_936327 [Guyanagaster necrorhizus MCA 3950]
MGSSLPCLSTTAQKTLLAGLLGGSACQCDYYYYNFTKTRAMSFATAPSKLQKVCTPLFMRIGRSRPPKPHRHPHLSTT